MHQPRTLALDKGRHSFYTQGNGEQVNSIRARKTNPTWWETHKGEGRVSK